VIISVRQRVEPLTNVGAALAALLGAGVAKVFGSPEKEKNVDPYRIPPARAIEVNCDDEKAGYAKAGFYAAGFEVPTATGAAPEPEGNDLVVLTVTPAKLDNLQNYPLGREQWGIIAAKALQGAFVTRPIGQNGDAYIGDEPGKSMQVSCYRADVPRVKGGFFAANFNAA
jgi:hypothetical protein